MSRGFNTSIKSIVYSIGDLVDPVRQVFSCKLLVFLVRMDPSATATTCTSSDDEFNEPPEKRQKPTEESTVVGEKNASTLAVADAGEKKLSNPWPHLQPVLQFCGSTPKGLQFSCMLCKAAGKKTTLRCDRSSSSNLKNHLKKIHLLQRDVWEPVLSSSSSSSAHSDQPAGENPFSNKRTRPTGGQ